MVISLERAVASNSGMGRTRTQKTAETVTMAMRDLARSDTSVQLRSGKGKLYQNICLGRNALRVTLHLNEGAIGQDLGATGNLRKVPKGFFQ